MSFQLKFSNDVPSWTKLGTAEFFRIIDSPEDSENEIQNTAVSMGIQWNRDGLFILAKDESTLNKFLVFCADWYTRNKLSLGLNYDLLVKYDSEGKPYLSESPIVRPATLGHIRINTSNYKPARTKEIKIESLPRDLQEEVDKIRKSGMINGKSYEGLKNAKLWSTERYIEFNVITTTGKKGTCYGCGVEDYLTETKMTQYPSTVGLENFSNFFSYHRGKIGFCRACSISNHFALMRVMYFSNRESTFLAVPESNKVQELAEFLITIEDIYQIQKLQKKLMERDRIDRIVISRSNYQYSNFIDKPQRYSGFYFLILAMFVAIREGIREIASSVEDNIEFQRFTKSAILRDILGAAGKDLSDREYDKILYRSWVFTLLVGDQLVRNWRYQSAPEALELIESINTNISSHNFMSIVADLIYKVGNSLIDARREEFSRSILYGDPSIGILERYTWDALLNGQKIKYGLREVAIILSKFALGGNEMEKNEIIQQCKSIGMKVADLAKEDNSKSLLYELRSVGNAQSLRVFMEKLTFLSVLKGRVTGISNEFIDALSEGEEWSKYKSIIAIVANQRYSYLNGKAQMEASAE
jgi:hypothetical protein